MARPELPLTLFILRSEHGKGRQVDYIFTVTVRGEERRYASVPMQSIPIDQHLLLDVQKETERVASGEDDLGEFGQTLFQEFLAKPIRNYIAGLEERWTPVLEIVTNDVHIPWELVHDGQEFWCLKYPMGRVYATRVGSGQPKRRRANVMGGQPRVAILVDPTGDLPEAKEEGRAVREKVRGKFAADLFQGDQVTHLRLGRVLFSGQYDIVHYAGHAEFSTEASRWRLARGGWLDEDEVRNYTLTSNPVLFCNACGSAKNTYVGDRARGLASAFIQAGASAYVGALWRVSDGVAAEFATAFYESLLSKEPLGRAMVRGRTAAREHCPKSADWAAFVLYGYPERILYSGTRWVRMRISDAQGTLARILGALAELGVNLVNSRSVTFEAGEVAGYEAEVQLPEGLSFDDLRSQMMSRCRDLLYNLDELR